MAAHILVCFLIVFMSTCFYEAAAQCPTGYVPSKVDSNKCYRFVTDWKISWSDAVTSCRAAHGGYLVSIQSAFENNNVQIDEGGSSRLCNYWIGLNDVGQTGRYVWSDNAPVNYQNWLPGQPDNLGKCASMLKSNGKWTIENCATLNCYVCETFIVLPTYLPPSPQSTDCYDLLHYEGKTTSGVYQIYPPGIAPFQVYCDMTTNGGGWTVFQKRTDNTTMFFNRSWTEFKDGFGDRLDKNAWLGLDRVNLLSNKDGNVTLRINIFGNRCPQSQCNISTNSHWFGEWGGFQVENETMSYTLRLAYKIGGNMTNEFSFAMLLLNNRPFIVIPNGSYDTTGAWWWAGQGGYIFLNGKYEYDTSNFDKYHGFCYRYFDGTEFPYFVYPIESQIMLRKLIAA